MYCPQCGTESHTEQRFCRSCGANLKVIGKAVALSEAIARSDRGPLPKIKEMMKSLKVEQTTEEIAHALEQMNREIVRNFSAIEKAPSVRLFKKEEQPEERRENHIVKGIVSLFTGIALMIFLYYFSAALILKIPPEELAKLPFELEPVVRIAWLIGLLPTLSGLGRIIAGLLIRPAQLKSPQAAGQVEPPMAPMSTPQEPPRSVLEHTTEMLDQKTPVRRS